MTALQKKSLVIVILVIVVLALLRRWTGTNQPVSKTAEGTTTLTIK